jgi:enoyl-CoA hydratase/carnithine racemase
MAQSGELTVERRGTVTVVTLNRPERHNALSLSMADALKTAVVEFNADDAQKVLIITGAGDKAFCSGADLKAMSGADDGVPYPLPVTPEPDIVGIASCEKPVIAAINGLAVGGGLEIALCCDIRLAADDAWFALPEPSRGFIAGVAAIVLPRLIPIGAAFDMMLTGERMSAESAFRLGLVQNILPREKLMEEAERKAQLISKHSRPALAGTKSVLRFWRDVMLAEQYQYYNAVAHRVLLSGDIFEGLDAFREKRAPHFSKGWPGPRPRE